MAHSLCNREISVVKLNVLTDKADSYVLVSRLNLLDHLVPILEIGSSLGKIELTANYIGEVALLKHNRCLIENGNSLVLYNAITLNVAEKCNLIEDALVLNRLIGTKNQNVRIDSECLKLLYGMLCGLGLVLLGSGKVRNKSDVNEERILSAHLEGNLTDGLKERL